MGAFADSLKQTNLPPVGAQQSPGGGPLGFLGNVFGEAKDITQGLAGLVGSGLHDLGRGVGQLIPGRQDWGVISDNPQDQYLLDDIATALPGAVWSDLVARYGPLLRGDVGEFGHQLYERPLSFGLDALAVGSAGASVAGRVAGTAAKASPVATSALEGIGRGLLEAGVRPRSALAAGRRAGLEALGGERALSPLESLAERVLPRATHTLIGDRFVPTTQAYNPVTRAALSPIQRRLTEPLAALEHRVGALQGEMTAASELGHKVPEALVAEYGLQSHLLGRAQELGLSRITRPGVSQGMANLSARRFFAAVNGRFLQTRLAAARRYQTELMPFMREAPDLAETGAARVTGLDAVIEGIEPVVWAQRIGDQLDEVRPLGRAERLDDPLTMEARDIQSRLVGHLQSLAEIEVRIRGVLSRTDTPKGRIRAIRKALGEDEFRRLRTVIGPAPAELDAFVEAVIQGLPEGGILRRLLAEATPVARRPRGYAAALSTELRDVLGDIHYRLLLEGTATTAQILARVRRTLRETIPESSRLRMVSRAPVMASVGGGAGVGTIPALRSALSDAGRAAVEGANPIASRVEAVAERLRAYRARLQDPSDIVHQRIADAATEIDATDRLIDQLYAGLDRGLRHDAPGPETVLAGERMTDRLRLLDMEKMVDEFDALKSSPRQVLEETYVPLRLKYGASWDETGTVLEHGPSVEDLDDAFRAGDQAAPTYFPFIDPERMRSLDWFTSKKPVGANIFARDPHLGRMKGILLMEGSYIRNPIEAYTRRAVRGVRAMETFRQMMETVGTFGRPIAKTGDLPAGYVVMAPDLLFLHHRTGFRLEDTLDDLLSQGMERDAAMAQALQAVTVKNADDVAALLAEGTVKMWAVPKVVAERLNDAARAAGFVSGKGRLWHDSIIQAWRGLVLSGSPRWVVNNFLGNTVFALMQGVKTADVMRSLGAHFSETVLKRESAFLRELRRLPGYEDVPSGFVGSTVGQYEYVKPGLASSPTYRFLRRIGETPPLSAAAQFGRGMRTLNALIEDAFRSASFLTAAERQLGIGAIRRTGRSFMNAQRRIADIMAWGFDETKARAALAEVTRFFGNYGALGPYERHVVRRFLVPFYGFYKHQLKLLVSFPFEYPGKGELLAALGRVQNELIAEYGPIPEWLQGATPFGPPGQAEVPFFSGRGPNPFSASFATWTDMLSPPLKIALERARGEQLFTGRPFTSPDVITPFGSDRPFRIIRDEGGNVVGVEPLEGDVLPGFGEHLLQQIPQYQALKEGLAGGNTYDTATLLDALQGQAAQIDPATGEARYPTGIPEQLLRLFGLGTTPYDLASFQERLTEEQKAALSAALARFG